MKLVEILGNIFHPQHSNNHRSKILHHRSIVFLILIIFGFYQLINVASHLEIDEGNILGFASNITSSQVIDSTNALRIERGIGLLREDPYLTSAAIMKARDMFDNQYWAHTSPTGKEPWDFIREQGYTYRVAGENLAKDFDTTSPMMQAWMNSVTHRENIVNSVYQDIGVAVVNGRLNGTETTLVVQMFGVKSAPQTVVPVVSATLDTPPEEVAPVIIVQAPTPTLTPTPTPTPEPSPESSPDPTPEPVEDQSTQLISNQFIENTPTGFVAGLFNSINKPSAVILYSPKHLLKAVFLSAIFLLVAALIYDGFVAGHKNSVRLVGKNLAHIMLLMTVAYLIIAFKGGVIGP
jgi:hypothetical protein